MSTLLVSGASGQLGQRVLHHLLHTLQVPPQRVIATTRTPERLVAWATRGVRVRVADFDQPSSLTRAFLGASRMLLISSDAQGPGQRLQQHERAIAEAENVGVTHLVYTSMPDPVRSLVLFAHEHADTEAVLADSRLPGWSVLRNHWYFENLQMLLPGVLARGGKWFSAAGEGLVADIARDDAALAAAHVLAGGFHGRETYTLSGPEALSATQQAQRIAAAIGRSIEVVHVSADDLWRGMAGAGVPKPLAQLLASFDLNTATGHMDQVSGDFERIVGHRPRTLEDWLAANHAQLMAGDGDACANRD